MLTSCILSVLSSWGPYGPRCTINATYTLGYSIIEKTIRYDQLMLSAYSTDLRDSISGEAKLDLMLCVYSVKMKLTGIRADPRWEFEG